MVSLRSATYLRLSLLLYVTCAVSATVKTDINVLAVLPSVWKSHYLFAKRLLEQLVAQPLSNKTYHVTLISPHAEPHENLSNWQELQVNGLLQNWHDMGLNFDLEQQPVQRHNVIERVTRLIYASTTNVDLLLDDNAVRQLLQRRDQQPFDLLVVDLLLSDALLGLAHYYQTPLVVISAGGSHGWLDQLLGNPRNPAIDPSSFLSFTEQMNFWQRCLNTLMTTFESLTYSFFHTIAQQSVYAKHFQPLCQTQDMILPDHAELTQNISLVLLNSHPALQYPRAFLPNMLEIAGAHLQLPVNNLPEDIEKHIETSPLNMTIYISLGADARTSDMSRNKLESLLDVCEKLADMHFLLKWEQSEYKIAEKLPKNVHIAPWYPQQAILSHPNVVAFVTTCGLLSVVEAISTGTPMLAIPILPEQESTAKRLERRGVALTIHYDEINYNKLLYGIQELSANHTYATKLKLLQRQFEFGCNTPAKRVLKYVDLLMDGHLDGTFLQSYANKLTYWRLELIDVCIILFLGLTTIIAVPFVVTCCILRRSYANTANSIQNKKDIELLNSVGDLVFKNNQMRRHSSETISSTSSVSSIGPDTGTDQPILRIRKNSSISAAHLKTAPRLT